MPLFEKTKEEVSLLIDIGNGSITSSFVVFSTAVPRFLHSIQSNFAISNESDYKELLDSMSLVLNDNLLSIMKYGFKNKYWLGKRKKISRVMMTFSSPWFLPKTKHIHLVNEKEFIITETFLEQITEKEEEIFKKEIIEDFKGSVDSFEVIEKSIVNIKINGYTMQQSIGNKTKILDAFLCMSIVSKTVLDKIYNIVLKNTLIPKEKVFIHTFPLASFSVIRDIFSNYSNFLIVDVTGEVTDMTLIQNDVITKTTTFPSGRNFAIRQLAKAFDVPIEVAESSLHLYTSKKIDEVMSKRIEEVLVDIEKEWSIYLENALLSLSSESILPSRVYLTSDSDVSQLFIDFLKLPKTDTTAIFRKNIDVVHIDKGILSKMYKNDSLTNVNEFIAILAIFYNKIINNR